MGQYVLGEDLMRRFREIAAIEVFQQLDGDPLFSGISLLIRLDELHVGELRLHILELGCKCCLLFGGNVERIVGVLDAIGLGAVGWYETGLSGEGKYVD
jgi:hypothetical protein